MSSVCEYGNIFEQIQITSKLTSKIDKCQNLIHIRLAGKCHILLISTSQILLYAQLLGKHQVYLGILTEKFRTDGWIKFVKWNTPILICCYSAYKKGKVNLFCFFYEEEN